jgi:hypothetical protein
MRQGICLDHGYLQDWVAKLGLEPEWEKARRFAGS